MGWQWHQVDHMQIICTSLQTDNHTSTSPLSLQMPFLLHKQQRQSTVDNSSSLSIISSVNIGFISVVITCILYGPP